MTTQFRVTAIRLGSWALDLKKGKSILGAYSWMDLEDAAGIILWQEKQIKILQKRIYQLETKPRKRRLFPQKTMGTLGEPKEQIRADLE